jgi:hypothetical protein
LAKIAFAPTDPAQGGVARETRKAHHVEDAVERRHNDASAKQGGGSYDVLADGSLVLSLDGACIQSAVQRAHRELTVALLEGRATIATAGALIDLLAQFLDTQNFPALRAEHPELSGQRCCRVRIFRSDDVVRWKVVTPI